jgi:hypothetical protein
MRYFSLLLLTGCTVLGTGYKSTLRTHLMFPQPGSIPTTFDDLADRTDFGVAYSLTGALERHFWATSEVRAVRKLRKRLTIVKDWDECYKKAFLSQKQACISWVHGKAVVAKRLTLNTTVEPIIYSKDAVIRKFLSLGFQENSIYVDSFIRILGTSNSMGIIGKWEEDIWTKFKKMGREYMLTQEGPEVFNELVDLAKPQDDAVPLQLESVIAVIAFIPIGCALGAIAFACERYRFRKVVKSNGLWVSGRFRSLVGTIILLMEERNMHTKNMQISEVEQTKAGNSNSEKPVEIQQVESLEQNVDREQLTPLVKARPEPEINEIIEIGIIEC